MDCHEDASKSIIDWGFLKSELRAWTADPTESQAARWMGLCITAGLSARASYAWKSCVFGGAVAVVHTSYCNIMAGKTDQAILDMALDVSFGGWPDAVLRSEWDVFTLLSVQSKMLLRQRPSLLAEALASSISFSDPASRSCAADRHVNGKSLLECAWHVAGLPEDQLKQEEENVVVGTELSNSTSVFQHVCPSEEHLVGICRTAGGLAGASACLMHALHQPSGSEALGLYVAAAEVSFSHCFGLTGHVGALWRSAWPLTQLLGRLSHKYGAVGSRRLQWEDLESTLHQFVAGDDTRPSDRDPWVADWRRQASSEVVNAEAESTFRIVVLHSDYTAPWTKLVHRALQPQELLMALPWPTSSPSFLEVRAAVLELVRAAGGAPGYPSPQNYGNSWRAICLVCVNGTQDATTADGVSPYLKTAALKAAPALEQFIDAFGQTARVRISAVVANGGSIGWHADDGVYENGRLILHVPIQTTVGSLNRLGNIVFHPPEGQLYWADYALPHTVYNADPVHDRLHIIIDVLVQNNTEFRRNILDAMTPEAGNAFWNAAVLDVGASAISSAGHGSRRDMIRSISSDMVRSYGGLFGTHSEMVDYEMTLWQRLALKVLPRWLPES